jgi:hypothetical protein
MYFMGGKAVFLDACLESSRVEESIMRRGNSLRKKGDQKNGGCRNGMLQITGVLALRLLAFRDLWLRLSYLQRVETSG